MSSDSSFDDDNQPELIQSSLKHKIRIKHPGVPPKELSQFARPTLHPKWPEDLWDCGPLIYDVESPERFSRDMNVCNDRILRFDSKFESGNLERVYLLSNDSYHCVLELDKNNSGSCQWFYFKMMNVKSDIKYTFYISGFHKNTGLFQSGAKIFYYSEQQYLKDGTSWRRGGTNYAYGLTRHKKKGKRSTLQFQIKFPFNNDTVYMCYALPYTYSDLLDYLVEWQNKAPAGSFSWTTLCKSVAGRDCPIITLTDPDSHVPYDQKKCLFFTGRIHPGESNGSVVLHGLIDYLVSDTIGARYLRSNFLIKIVPMVNIDGVIEGFYRISLSGQDLNRVWKNPDPILHPVVTSVKEHIKKISSEREIAVYLDFHGHSRLHGTFAYGCPNDENPSLRGQEKLFPRMLSLLCDAFSWSNCVFSFPVERKAASRIVVRTEVDVVQSFTIETSFGGIVNGARGGFLYNETIWKEIGMKCGETLYHMFLDESPVRGYINQELLFMNPEEPDEVEEKPDINIQYSQEVPGNTFDFPLVSKTKSNRQGPLLQLKKPTKFLLANSRTLSSDPPGFIAPKWDSLQYTI